MGYREEIQWTENVKLCQDVDSFLCEYIWVVVNSGMKNQIAEKIYKKIIEALKIGKLPDSVFNHEGKTDAIIKVISNLDNIFNNFLNASDKIAFLKTLPFIGKITKYHLARNLGLDCCKPNRHLERIASNYRLKPFELCKMLSKLSGDRIGTVDVILW